MQIVCPVCNARYALEAALSDADARRAVAAAGRLPSQVAELALAYIGLFRPAKSALSWRRAARLLDELREMVEAGGIRRRGRAWKAGVNDFSAALETVLSRRDKLTLPLKNHGYLEEVLVGIVDKSESADERATESSRRQGRPRETGPVSAAEIVEKRMRREWDRELGLVPKDAGGEDE